MKTLLLVFTCLVLGFELVFGAAEGDWKYGNESFWPGVCTTGTRQSPIDIETNKAENKTVDDFVLERFDQKFTKLEFNHTGTTIKLNLAGTGMKVSKGGLTGTYEILQLHFHWSKAASDTGAEHQIDGKKYPLELHIVSKNGDNPVGSQHAVLGFVFEVDAKNNSNLETFTSHLDDIIKEDSSTMIDLKLMDLLPSDRKVFYRYEGSLTTPGCDEDVIWTVFEKPIKISQSQLEKFQNIRFSHGDANYRSPQTLGKRKVRKLMAKPPTTADPLSTADHIGLNILTIFASFLIFLIN